MPVHPTEENATGNLTDQVAKDSKDSTASTHKLHDVDTGAKSGGAGDDKRQADKATPQDHRSTPGIVQADGDRLPKAAGSEELKARAAELNK